ARTTMQLVKLLSTQFDSVAVIRELKELADSLEEPKSSGTNTLKGKLKRLSEKLNPLDQFKKSGVESVPEEWKVDAKAVTTKRPRAEVENLLRDLESHGLLLVPKGELESWLPVLMDGIGRGDKGNWA